MHNFRKRGCSWEGLKQRGDEAGEAKGLHVKIKLKEVY